MRNIPPRIVAMLEADVMTCAVCVRVERRDGFVIGFTDHDKLLTIASVEYEALSSAVPSAIRTSVGNTVDSMDFVGILRSERLTDADLLAGRYDGAKITPFLCDWTEQPITETLTLMPGIMGNITVRENEYLAEIRSLTQRLRQVVGEIIQPGCRVRRWADAQCSPPGNTSPTSHPENFRFNRNIAFPPADPHTLRFLADTHPDHYYRNGVAKFLTGKNAQIERTIKDSVLLSGQQDVTLHQPFPAAVAANDQAMLEKGCDRQWKTCGSDYQNWENFAGEPFLPGFTRNIQIGRH